MYSKPASNPGRDSLICLVLAIVTLVAFWPVGRFGFVNYDDWNYVLRNPNVQAGINVDSIRWAFFSTYSGNWHPVTWLSHMLDCILFGLKAGGHHWMNLGFHILNTGLLFLVLRRMTAAVWRCALVAGLFALHPLHVESVVWISERKDVLSGLFFMLTLLCYAKAVKGGKWQVTGTEEIVREPFMSRVTCHMSPFYWLAVCFFALGLMSKAMLVTLPFFLLLLDFWPLGRMSEFGVRNSELNK